MGRKEFLETVSGQRHLLFNRRRERQIFLVNGEPKSKNAISSQEKHAFQQQVAASMAKFKRRPYRGPIVVELDFTPSSRNPPALHTLAKNYLDLLQWPVDRPSSKARVLFDDDRLVKVLIVNCWYGAKGSEPRVTIRSDSFRNLMADLSLAERIRHGRFEREGYRSLDTYMMENLFKTHVFDPWEEDDDDDDGISLNLDPFALARVRMTAGDDAMKLVASSIKERIQRHFLRARQLRLDDLMALYPFTSGLFVPATLTQRATRRDWAVTGPMVIDFKAPPSKEGETKIFKERVMKALEDFQARWDLFPILFPVTVNVFYLPPIDQGIDLDNLARYVVPFVEQAIKPKGLPPTLPDPTKVEDEYVRTLIRVALIPHDRKQEFSVSRYQIFKLDRMVGDPPEGFVRLSFGKWDADSLLRMSDDLIDAWEDLDRY